MGIKTRFNPMGGQNEKGSLGEWRYSTAANGQITLYEYLGSYSSIKPVYVPVKRGKTVINNYTSGSTTTASNTPFYNNPDVKMVDLQNVPFVNNNMYHAFDNCRNLTSVTGINQNVTNMFYTFYGCYNLNQNIQIPNSVTNMYSTFFYCMNLNQNIQIPSGVTNMVYTFDSCYNLNQNIQIPSGVTNTAYTFFYCNNLNQNIQIPNRVISMYVTFYHCNNLNQNIQIPNSVTNMYGTFDYCTNLQGTITINSANISNTYNCFRDSGLTKNVIFPSRYIDNTYTITRNSLVSAGYAVGTAAGNLVNNTAQNAVFYAYDPVSWEGYNAWVGDGANWRLTKWGGIGKAAGQTSIKVPTSITSYDTFPTVISNTCFYRASNIAEIDCQHVPIYPLASSGDNHFFGYMVNVNSVYNFNCKDSTQLYGLIYNSVDLNSFSTGTPQQGTFFLNMSNDVTNAQAMCGHAKGISNFYLLSNGTLKVYAAFNACNTRSVNVYFVHNVSSNSTNWFRNYSSSYRKNIYLYYTFSNGTVTNVFNQYKAATYMGTSGNSASGGSPRYNSTSNYYFYNMSQDYCPTTNNSWWCCPINGALRYTGAGYSDNTPITFPTSLSVQQYPDKYTTVSTNTQNMSNMFRGFFKINVPITIPNGVTNMSYTFRTCYNFNQNIQIPNSVTSMYQTFYWCANLNQNIQIPNSVTDMYATFFSCTNLQGTINVLSNQITNAVSCFSSTSLPKNVYIPFKYSNGVNSATFNSFVSAGYLYANGVSNNQHGVTVYDLNS